MWFRCHDSLVWFDQWNCPLQKFQTYDPAYSLPPGMVGEDYDGSTHRTTDGSSTYPGVVPWPQGDAYLSNAAGIMATIDQTPGPGGWILNIVSGLVSRWNVGRFLVANEVGFVGYPSVEQQKAAGYNPRGPRILHAIHADLLALTAGQKNNVWNDLSAGTPPKALNYTGANSGAIVTFYWAGTSVALPSSDVLSAKVWAASMYVQDNVNYLVHPAFDPTINVPGDQPL